MQYWLQVYSIVVKHFCNLQSDPLDKPSTPGTTILFSYHNIIDCIPYAALHILGTVL